MNQQNTNMDRRAFMKQLGVTAAGLALASSSLSALGKAFRADAGGPDEQYDFLLARVRFDADHRVMAPWNTYPGADLNLLTEFSSAVRCKVKHVPDCRNDLPSYGRDDQFNAIIDFDNAESFRKYPFAFMTGEGQYQFTSNQKENLKSFLTGGGFLFMDDCVYDKGGDFFYQSSYRLLEETFAAGAVVEIPKDHEIFHNVFDFGQEGMPFMQGQRYGARGVFIGNRLCVFLSATDLHCGWTNPDWFGQQKYRAALQMGVNILMYAISH